MGSPKALLRYGTKTFVESIVDACLAAGLDPVVAVLGEDADNILNLCDLSRSLVVRNPAPETGQIGSLKLGLAAISNRAVEAALVWPVDQPHVRIETVSSLLARFRGERAAIALPTYEGRRGHPVVFSRSVFDELLAAPAALGARAVVRADPTRVLEVPVTDRAVVEDIDTPESYEALLRGLEEAGG